MPEPHQRRRARAARRDAARQGAPRRRPHLAARPARDLAPAPAPGRGRELVHRLPDVRGPRLGAHGRVGGARRACARSTTASPRATSRRCASRCRVTSRCTCSTRSATSSRTLERRYAARIQIIISDKLMPHQSEIETRTREVSDRAALSAKPGLVPSVKPGRDRGAGGGRTDQRRRPTIVRDAAREARRRGDGRACAPAALHAARAR